MASRASASGKSAYASTKNAPSIMAWSSTRIWSSRALATMSAT